MVDNPKSPKGIKYARDADPVALADAALEGTARPQMYVCALPGTDLHRAAAFGAALDPPVEVVAFRVKPVAMAMATGKWLIVLWSSPEMSLARAASNGKPDRPESAGQFLRAVADLVYLEEQVGGMVLPVELAETEVLPQEVIVLAGHVGHEAAAVAAGVEIERDPVLRALARQALEGKPEVVAALQQLRTAGFAACASAEPTQEIAQVAPAEVTVAPVGKVTVPPNPSGELPANSMSTNSSPSHQIEVRLLRVLLAETAFAENSNDRFQALELCNANEAPSMGAKEVALLQSILSLCFAPPFK